MSNRKSLLAYYNFHNLFLLVTRYRSCIDRPIPYYPHPVSSSTVPRHRCGSDEMNQGLHLLYADHEVHNNTHQHAVTNMPKPSKRRFKTLPKCRSRAKRTKSSLPITNISGRNNVDGKVKPVPFRPNHDYPSWTRWVFAAVLSLFLPFWKVKWNKLLRLEGEVEMAVEVVEHVAEGVERVAAVSEKLSREVADNASNNNRKLKEAALFVERFSKEIEKDARFTEDIIHKVDELKEEVDMLIESVVDKPGKGKSAVEKD